MEAHIGIFQFELLKHGLQRDHEVLEVESHAALKIHLLIQAVLEFFQI